MQRAAGDPLGLEPAQGPVAPTPRSTIANVTTIWNSFGFRESPYATEPVPPSEEGEHLFVGRAAELRRLRLLLNSSATHPTIEGVNGVGKTSLVSVAGYKARRQFEKGETGQLLIPLAEPFQMTPGEGVAAFVRRLYFSIAQGFIDNHTLLKRAGMPVPDVEDVEKWLNSPIFTQREGGFQIASTGPTYGKGDSPNTSAGFTESWLPDRGRPLAARVLPLPAKRRLHLRA
jgi:hypothetical protein